jgi:hypothetical protein
MDLKPIYDSEEEEKDTSSPLDEFKEFIVELWDMLKQDFRNSINFISSNKSFFITAALLAILLQVSSVSNLGASFEKYCGSRDMRGDMRGGGEEPVSLSFQDMQKAELKDKADKKAEAAKKRKESKIQTKSDALVDKMKEADTKTGSVKTEEEYKAKAKNITTKG